ncbi:hypothetical protein TRV_07793 [Trichophyton verrucosum HKI 0517]|uniref:Uncharacterized protein n=1 Tax=Trichophyton verrucosum (strain HKI 0517) TaxID=663202 RepID=D4DKR9_TRIVH|nr:uncharacterized protein TRV_07793 [Trichophyton verrucosum HKI 0517]EFE37573.1 hypothetical protein TRV_07793 [Trichophyton verrucosum HKI 0517]
MGIDTPSLKLAVDNAHVLLDSVTSRLLLQHCFNHGNLTFLRRDSAICGNEMVYINPLLDWNPPSLLFISTSSPKASKSAENTAKRALLHLVSCKHHCQRHSSVLPKDISLYLYIYKNHQEQVAKMPAQNNNTTTTTNNNNNNNNAGNNNAGNNNAGNTNTGNDNAGNNGLGNARRFILTLSRIDRVIIYDTRTGAITQTALSARRRLRPRNVTTPLRNENRGRDNREEEEKKEKT